MSMSSSPFSRRLNPSVLISLLFATTSTALFETGSSLAIQDPFLNPPPSTCPVSQDGVTSNTFPWTHNPTCVNAVLPSPDNPTQGVHQDFCVYTNANFHSGRGISFITTPELAAELTAESFQPFGDDRTGVGEIYDLKDSGSKGLGVFSKRQIEAGTGLIAESPILLVAKEALLTPSRQRRHLLLSRAVEQLPLKTREAFMALAKSRGGFEVDDIVQTNSVAVKLVDPAHLAVVPATARINHACRPNAFYKFDDYTLTFEVVALKDISAGEEISISYGFSKQIHEERLDALETNWGFTCKCSLCASGASQIAASDQRIKEIASIKAVLPTEEKDIPQLLGLLPDLISLLDEEDLHLETPMYEEILAYTYSTFSNEEKARYWAGRARRHWAVLMGNESWEAMRTKSLEDDVKGHGTWASWEGETWNGTGKGHPWDDDDDGHGHEHEPEH